MGKALFHANIASKESCISVPDNPIQVLKSVETLLNEIFATTDCSVLNRNHARAIFLGLYRSASSRHLLGELRTISAAAEASSPIFVGTFGLAHTSRDAAVLHSLSLEASIP